MNNTNHISATAAFAWRNVWSESVKMIAAHQPTRASSMRACDAVAARRREPQAKIVNAVSAAATADGKRAAKSLSPKM
jgi:hypothetical protein